VVTVTSDEEPKYTNIRLRKDTLARLKSMGRMGESYDDVIQRILPKKYRRKVETRKV
jgi:predicted CopG family antitoxin